MSKRSFVPRIRLWYKSCPRCHRGDIIADSDQYGTYLKCVQCGHQIEGNYKTAAFQRNQNRYAGSMGSLQPATV